MKTTILSVLVLMVCMLSFSAQAKDLSDLSPAQLEKAEELRAQAEAFFKSRDYEKALPLYQDVYNMTGKPGLIFNIAQCHKFLGHPEEAIQNYRLYLAKEPKSQFKPQIEIKITELEEKLSAAKVAAATQPTIIATTQPVLTPSSAATVTQDVFSLYATKEIATAFDEVEALIQKSEEDLAKVEKHLRFVPPVGIALVGGLFGTGSLIIRSNINLNNRVNNQIQAEQLTLAIASDLAFIAAGVTLYRAIKKNKKESSFEVSFAPTNGGGFFALSFQPRSTSSGLADSW
jgi:tetratricopeptide (TPR) repeat protein